MTSMRALHQAGHGSREQLSVRSDTPKPKVGARSILVAVKAVSVNSGDHHMLTGRPYIIRVAARRATQVPGMDFAGVVAEVGSDVPGSRSFAVGDEVFGTVDTAGGAFADFVDVPYDRLAQKPTSVSFEDASAVPTAGMTALGALRAGQKRIAKGDRVLVHGASGGVGSYAVQIAKAAFGAHVTAVCSTRNVELVRSLGADEVIDYTQTSIEQHVKRGGGKFDLVLDIVGRNGSWVPFLNAHGSMVAVALPETEWVPCMLIKILCTPCCCCWSSRKQRAFLQEVQMEALNELGNMLEEKQIRSVTTVCRGLEALCDALAGNSTTTGLGHTVGKAVCVLDTEHGGGDATAAAGEGRIAGEGEEGKKRV